MNNEILTLAISLEQQRENAMMNGDGELLDSIYSQDLIYGHSSGYAETKAEYLDNFNKKNYKYSFVKTTVKKATAIGTDGIIINGEMVNHAVLFDKETNMHSIYLAVWRLEEGKWHFLSNQTALIR
jgi:hypothetical protein